MKLRIEKKNVMSFKMHEKLLSSVPFEPYHEHSIIPETFSCVPPPHHGQWS